MKKLRWVLAVLVLLGAAACGTESITGPEEKVTAPGTPTLDVEPEPGGDRLPTMGSGAG